MMHRHRGVLVRTQPNLFLVCRCEWRVLLSFLRNVFICYLFISYTTNTSILYIVDF
jgi:hypothetical protein